VPEPDLNPSDRMPIKEVERAVIGIRSDGFKSGSGTSYGQRGGWQSRDVSVTAPGSEAAARWEGWGTALKPAWEPVLVGRKPC
jgi:site-specific DNA-methyltransferase (adenine-specific)